MDFVLANLPLLIVMIMGIRMSIQRFNERKPRVSRILTMVEAFNTKNNDRR